MRLGEVVAIFLLVVLVLGVVYVFDQKAKYKQDRDEWLQYKAELQTTIDDAEFRAKAEEDKALEALAEADEAVAERDEIKEQLRVEKAAHERALNQIKTLAPDQIVIAHHYHLDEDSTGIWLNSYGIQFSLDASRKNLTVLEEYDFVIKTEIPNYKSQMEKQEEENAKLRESNTGFYNSNKQLHLEIDALVLQVAGEARLRLKAESLVGFSLFSIETVLIFLGGLVLGGLAALVF